MAVDKGLYAAPVGLASLEEEPIEIEIVAEGEGDFPEEVEKEESEFDANLAEEMDEGQLMSLAGDLLGELDGDLSSRKEWLDTYIKGLKLLGLKYEERSEPWAGACGVFHPLLMESAVKFQSETIMETFPAGGPTDITARALAGREAIAATAEASAQTRPLRRLTGMPM